MEREFLGYDMKYYSRFIGPAALMLGVIYMLFIIGDCFAIESAFSFAVILIIRILFLTVSVVLYFAVKK